MWEARAFIRGDNLEFSIPAIKVCANYQGAALWAASVYHTLEDTSLRVVVIELRPVAEGNGGENEEKIAPF